MKHLIGVEVDYELKMQLSTVQTVLSNNDRKFAKLEEGKSTQFDQLKNHFKVMALATGKPLISKKEPQD